MEKAAAFRQVLQDALRHYSSCKQKHRPSIGSHCAYLNRECMPSLPRFSCLMHISTPSSSSSMRETAVLKWAKACAPANRSCKGGARRHMVFGVQQLHTNAYTHTYTHCVAQPQSGEAVPYHATCLQAVHKPRIAPRQPASATATANISQC